MRETYEEGKVDHRLDMFNWIASGFQLPYFSSHTLSKQSEKSMQKILAHMWPYIFLHFPSNIQYIYWLGAKKIDLDFLMCACADYVKRIFPQ